MATYLSKDLPLYQYQFPPDVTEICKDLAREIQEIHGCRSTPVFESKSDQRHSWSKMK